MIEWKPRKTMAFNPTAIAQTSASMDQTPHARTSIPLHEATPHGPLRPNPKSSPCHPIFTRHHMIKKEPSGEGATILVVDRLPMHCLLLHPDIIHHQPSIPYKLLTKPWMDSVSRGTKSSPPQNITWFCKDHICHCAIKSIETPLIHHAKQSKVDPRPLLHKLKTRVK